ncbi:MAG TPA: class I SAM-dependent methyltransferase [Betaproteobacteria bacterium]|nr:class I SAM-dependent methyltransferase [Betaproteobacteria bacterium]
MNKQAPTEETGDQRLRAEFDLLADEYHEQHAANVAITGEGPAYFAEYKIADLAALVRAKGLAAAQILDFGSGIGNSVPYFRKYFGQSELHCGDVSSRSIEIAQTRFPGQEQYVLIGSDIPLPTHSQDIVFSACVFHHIPHEEHQHWLAELRRVTRPGGLLAIYEHNPLNPLTVRAVNTCHLDVNARLIRGGAMRQRAASSGWADAQVDYRLFFPSMLKSLRPLEQHLGWLGLGAQYRMAARCPA